MFCPECGHKNKDENKFCIGCGKLLEQGRTDVSFADVSTPAVTVENDNIDTPYLDDFLDSKNKAEQCEKHCTGVPENNDIELEQGVCPDCGYHNNSSSSRCIKCGKQLNEDTQISQRNSYSQISGNISSEIKPAAQSVNSNHSDCENNHLLKGNEQNQTFYQNSNFYETNSYMTSKKQIYTKDAQIKRIVIGIVAIVVSPIIMILSSTAGVLGAILSVNIIAGITGFLASIFLLTGGIISIAARKNKIGAITSSSFLCAAAAISFLGTGVYTNWDISFFDLRTWSYVAFILASTAVGTLTEKEHPEEKKQCIEDWILESILGVVLVIIIIATIKG